MSRKRVRVVAVLVVVLVLGSFLQASPASAVLLTGHFVGMQDPVTVGVGTDGQSFFIDGNTYPVPAELKPTGPWTFWLTPSHRVLYAFRSGTPTDCDGGAILDFHRLPDTGGQPLQAIQTDLCLAGDIAWDRFFDRPAFSPQEIAAVAERDTGAGSASQRILWVDLVTGTTSFSLFDPIIDEPGQSSFTPSGTAALVRFHTDSNNRPADFRLVDLCPGSVGATLRTYRNLGGQMTGEVVDTGGGSYVARLSHPALPGGSDDVPLADCLGAPPPPPPGTLLVSLTGSGTGMVVSSPAGISCGTDCDETYPVGQSVDLTAYPDYDSEFRRWGGDCSGTQDTISVTVGSATSCTAEFRRITADLEITKTAAPDPVVAGEDLVYTVTVTNHGPFDSTFATVSDPLPPDVRFASGPGCVLSGSTVLCSISGLAADASTTISFTVHVDPAATGPLVNTATVTGSEADPIAANDTATATTGVVGIADLSITKTAVPAAPWPGGPLVYQVVVHNDGPSSATGIRVTDQLPAGVTRLTGTSAVDCGGGSLRPGESRRFTIVARVDPTVGAGTDLHNTATVSADQGDPDASDNSSAIVTTVGTAPPPDTSPIVRLADLSTTVPGTAQTFSYFGVPSLGPETVAFGAEGATVNGVYRWSDGVLSTVTDSTDAIPGGRGTFAGFLPIPVAVDGATLSFNGYNDVQRQGPPAQDGIYVADECGVRAAVNQATPLPAPKATSDTNISGLSAGSGAVAFRANSAQENGIFLWDGSGVSLIADQDTPVPDGSGTFYLLGPPAFDGTTVAFWANDGINGNQGIYAWTRPAGPLVRVADFSTPPPGGSGAFGGFAQDMSLDHGVLAFVGIDASLQHSGVYAYDVVSGMLSVIADGSTPLPDGPGTFENVVAPAAVDDGRIAFMGGPVGGPAGIYVYDQGVFRPVVHQNDQVDGRTALYFDLGPQALSGDRVGFVAHFGIRRTDDQGAYLATVPGVVPIPTDCSGAVAGYTVIDGTPGNDLLVGTAGKDVICGEGGNDTISGMEDDDVLIGGPGQDRIRGGLGADRIDGGSGNDTILPGPGDDPDVDGGQGKDDTVSYADITSGGGQTVNLGGGPTSGGGGADTLAGFENATGSPQADSLTGDDGPNVLTGGDGLDSLSGMAGNDRLLPGKGSDSADGGSGADIVSYADVTGPGGQTVNLATPSSTGVAGTDSITAFENATGSPQDDTLTGDAAANALRGGSGNDTLAGGDGPDVLVGEDGSDSLSGGSGNDTVEPGLGDDPTVDGGGGRDVLSYADVTTGGQAVDLAALTSSGGGGTDAIAGFEDVTGSPLDDTLTGTAGNNTLTGGLGADVLAGGAGRDILRGRDGVSGNDSLDGGADAVADSCIADAGDTVVNCP